MDWVTCSHSPSCTGVARQPYGSCLSHLSPEQLTDALAAIRPGRLLDLRGTTIDSDLLARVLAAAEGRPGRARMDLARFTGEARFTEVSFQGDVSLDGARFDRLASFFGAAFAGNVSFNGARFARQLSFHGARVRGHAGFDKAVVAGDALFGQAAFARGLSAERARFDGFAAFDGAQFGELATFRGARFGRTLSFRKVRGRAGFESVHFASGAYLSATERLAVTGARVDGALDLAVEDCSVDLRRIEVRGTTAVRLSRAHADLESAVLRGRATVSGRGFCTISSLRGADAPDLSLFKLDLSSCRFAGLAHPSGLRLTGCTFAFTPRGVRFSLRWPPLRWFSRRRALADEHGWRGWTRGPDDPDGPDGPSSPDGIAALYDALRHAPDDDGTAADFAFGAMEMRRAATRRWWLSLYWLLCGYGLRTGRAVAWGVLLVALTAGAVLWAGASHAGRRATTPRPAVPGPAAHR
ncbi:pentapeptide repeat-containing protein [Nonomuraea sp. NPDC059194]|uniref:pentapeptide repeat-containing protein n=1 Tax=Nonomuraea sp. NPDC059194 TaxID=3346764 RepID=UPI00368B6A4D